MATVVKGPGQPHFPWAIAIAAFLIGLVAGYGLNEYKHSKDAQTFSINIPSERR